MSAKVLLIFLFFSYFLIQSFLFFLFSQSWVSYFPIFLSIYGTGQPCICNVCNFPTSGREQLISLYSKKRKNFIFLIFVLFSNDKEKKEAEEKPPMVSFGRLVSYRTQFQAEVINFDHWLIDSPTENSVLRQAAKIELACQQALHFTWRAKQTARKRASERAGKHSHSRLLSRAALS